MIKKLVFASMLLIGVFALSSCNKEDKNEVKVPAIEKLTMANLESVPSLQKVYTNQYVWFVNGTMHYFDRDKAKYSTGTYYKSCVIDGYNITLVTEEGWNPPHDVVYKGYISKFENQYRISNTDPNGSAEVIIGNLPEDITGIYKESMINPRP